MKRQIKHFLRKSGKYLVYALVAILIITLFIISDAYNRKHEFVFLTFPKNYSITSLDNSEINLYLYAREKRSMYLDMECISGVALIDNITKERYRLEDVSLTDNEDIINHQDHRYYGYQLKAIFPFRVEEVLLIENAYLEFNYHNGESLSLKVGSFAFDAVYLPSAVRISYLKGLTGSISNYVSLTAIIVEVTNDSDYSIVLDSLQFISPFLKVNYDYVMEIPEDIARSNILLEEILADYDYKKTSIKSHFNISVEAGTTKHLLIPLVYSKDTFINQVAFKINYCQQTDEMLSVTSPSFCYFKTTREVVPPEQLIYVRN